MPEHTTVISVDTTLSASQLFNRFLDKRCLVVDSSNLANNEVYFEKMSELYFSEFDCHSACLGDEVGARIIEGLRICDDPLSELVLVLKGLESMISRFQILSNSFSNLSVLTRIDKPEDYASGEEYCVSQKSARYTLTEAPGSEV